jgi:hypothetical protein
MRHIKLFEGFETTGEVNYDGDIFKLTHIHTNKWRLVKNREWQIVIGDTLEEATESAKQFLKLFYADGKPAINPRYGTKFVVTGEKFDYETGTVKQGNTITFITGSHNRNLGGTGKAVARKGDVLTFDDDGEDDGFWYLNGGKERMKGSHGWSLVWSLQIKPK